MNPAIDSQTPHLTVTDSRGLPIRQIAYCRRDVSELIAEARVTTRQHDAAGRAIAQRDPRLATDALACANLATIYSLSGKVLSTTSVDAGWRVSLLGEADQPVLFWDGRGSQRRNEYDDQLRPLAVFEQAVDGQPMCTERYGYGGADPVSAAHNQCGQPVRHDDLAGTQVFAEFGLTGAVLEQTRHFLRELDSPDWPQRVAERDKLLETGVGATTRSGFSALGEVVEQTDAKGNRQYFSQTVAGQLGVVRLQLANDTTPKTLVSAIQYNAHGQVGREVAGNDVITTLEYAAEDGRLKRLVSRLGQHDLLQDLRYAYDPVGNVLSIEDAALPIRYFANQRIEPINRYGYDSLYQLIEASGWEAGAANQGPSSSSAADFAAVGTYRQTYRYDAGNNLLELAHVGPQNHSHRLMADTHSNRCLPVRDGVEPGEEDFRNGFDANGNLRHLQPGQALGWDVRNQLCEVRPVEREDDPDDSERYVYGADGMRVRKVRSLQTNAQSNVIETRYLPGLEIRTHSGTGEALHVIVVSTGRGSVRVLHWAAGPPQDIANNQQRYSLTDHLGSSTLELDQDASIITQERYYPFGGTAWSNGEGVQVSYRTVRYSGKELDATGLYYYGFRYYVPWMQRWLNPDPAREVDGLNLYRVVRNNPVKLVDETGLYPNLPVPSAEDAAYFDDFLSSSRFKEFIDMRKEMNALGSGFSVLGVVVPNPFKRKDSVFDSREKLQAADYPIKNGLLYRAHLADVSTIQGKGLLRNQTLQATPDDYKEYIADVFKHTAGTGSAGAILSLSTKRDVAKSFLTEQKSLVTIDLNKLEPELARNFMTVPEIISTYAGMMLREQRIEQLDLIKALDQLNNKEYEVFFMGQDAGLNIGEVPSRAISAVKSKASKSSQPVTGVLSVA